MANILIIKFLKIYNELQTVEPSSNEVAKIHIENISIVGLLYLLRKGKGNNVSITVLDHACYKEPAPFF